MAALEDQMGAIDNQKPIRNRKIYGDEQDLEFPGMENGGITGDTGDNTPAIEGPGDQTKPANDVGVKDTGNGEQQNEWGYFRPDVGWQPWHQPGVASTAPAPAAAAPAANGAPPSAYQPPPAAAPAQPSANFSALSGQLMQMLKTPKAVNPNREALHGRIKGLMDEYSKPVTAQDPNIASRTNAFAGTTDRALNKFREFAAERAHANGMTSGAFDSQIGNAMTEGGLAQGNLENQLMSDEMNNRRGLLQNTIGAEGGLVNAEDANDLQDQSSRFNAILGGENADINQAGMQGNLEIGRGNLALGQGKLDLDKLLGMSDIDLRRELGRGQIGVGMAGVGSANRGQDLQNQQFYDRLGFDQSREANSLDNMLAQLLLSGG